MFNVPFGQPGPGQPLDVQSFVQQYWNAWGDAMRRAAEGPGAPMPGAHAWSDALNLWSQLAHGGRSEADQALDRFNRQAREWLVQMQQVATQFAGQSAGAREIVDAWRKALGTSSENPFPEMFRAMGAQAMPGLGQWVDDASPYLDSMRRELHANLSLPTFGLAREHQERLQALARAQLDHQERSAAFHALLARSGQRAFERFEDKLAEHEEPGRQIGSARALFDLWVDAAEDAYAETALTAEFREVYGALVNAQMRLRQGIQREVELFCEQFGIPGRTEVDSAHRKIAELQRELRRMRRSDEERPLRRRATPQPSNDATQAAGPTRAHTSGTPSESLQGTAARKSRKNQAAALPVTSGKKTAKQKKAARKAAKAAGENVAGGAAKKPAKKAAKKAAKAAGIAASGARKAVGAIAKTAARKAGARKAVTKESAGKLVKKGVGKKVASKKVVASRTAARKTPAGRTAMSASPSRSLLAGIPMPTAPRADAGRKGGR